MSFTHTSVIQSTAPKCNRMRPFFQLAGTAKVFWYHRALSGPTSFCTPDSDDSMQNGTRMSPSYFCGAFSPFAVMAYCHKPFRFFHSGRTIIGRGYSGSAFSGETSSAHFVLILSPAGAYWATAMFANSIEISKNLIFIELYFISQNYQNIQNLLIVLGSTPTGCFPAAKRL